MTPEFRTREALEEAIAVLTERAAATDTASPEGWRAREALSTIEALIAQQGCEVFDAGADDGRLTTLCDIIVFG